MQSPVSNASPKRSKSSKESHRAASSSSSSQGTSDQLSNTSSNSILSPSQLLSINSSTIGTRLHDSSLDLKDFPSLSRTAPNPLPSGRNYGVISKGSAEPAQEFHIHQEDFPALPGLVQSHEMTSHEITSHEITADLADVSSLLANTENSMNSSLLSETSYDLMISKSDKSEDTALSAAVSGIDSAVSLSSETSKTTSGIQTHPDGLITNIPMGMVNDQFGIVGLLTFIRAAETDRTPVALAPGIDLTTLGLNLNSTDNLYSTFQSPWAEYPCRTQDIDFHVPSEYLTNKDIGTKLSPIKLNQYGEDLLFFLFYMNGGDVLQLAAATELFDRDWRYHRDERSWITRTSTEALQVKTNTYERGTYYFFDAQNWIKIPKEFHLEYDQLEERPQLPAPPQSTADNIL